MKEFRFLVPVAGLFVAALMISNTIAVKIFALGPFYLPAGVIVFPVSYIFGDILTEVYGYARSRQVIWVGFIAVILMSFMYWLTIRLPPAPFWRHQESMKTIMEQVPRIVLATIIAYFAGEFTNAYVMAKMKILTKGKRLWMRTIGSTIAGEGIDSFLFMLIAFSGSFPFRELLRSIISVYIFKVFYEVLATPLTYIIVRFLKKAESIDYYDFDTKFSPFKWSK